MKKVIKQKILKISYVVYHFLVVLPLLAQVPEFDNDKPSTVYNTQYSQSFNTTWDGSKFYNQWSSVDTNGFTAADISNGYLQFVWIPKRIIYSKTALFNNYTFQTDMDYSAGSSRGGVVIRANTSFIDRLQEPVLGDPGFNSEGIAFYPSNDGSKMIVQFTGVFNGNQTPLTQILVEKPTGVANLRNRGTLTIEDFGTSIYVYYNGIPFIRINLTGKTGSIYTAGSVYNYDMQVVGTFTGMEVESSGKVAICQRDAALRLYNVSINSNYSNVSASSQDYVDNWVVSDALGRQLPTYAEVGSKRNNKLIGVFYYTWLGYHGNKVYDITKILKQYPSDPLSNNNPGWGGQNDFHFWGEPEQGYYRSEDPWVIRRDLQMLSNAHVDFIYIDATNAVTYLETVKTLCEVSIKMRQEGIFTPQIVFTTFSSSGQTINTLFDEFYSQDLYGELWFKWNGKPLIMGNIKDPVLRSDVKNFFTIKYSWAWTNTKNEPNHWQWMDNYPQDYGWSTNPSIPEQIVVTVASHPNNTEGKSYSLNSQPPINSNYLTDYTNQGLRFAEQWTRALQVDPPVIMVTQWNEWVAQRFIWDQGNGIYAGKPIKNGDSYFVDVFTQEFNRDIAPMKGGYTDNYYYQLISNIRKYKGMSAPQESSAPSTKTIDGDFSEWSSVTPVFRDPIGDTMHRDFAGYDPSVQFINNTGRNDIIESRATHDTNNIYFYVKTAQTLSPSTDPNWMLLFLDTDRNKTTGWEGYDYVVNLGVKSVTETTLKKWNGTNWSNEISVPFKFSGSELEISIPREAVMLNLSKPDFYFHWSDNAQQLDTIDTFFIDGESAPDRRFNFNFIGSEVTLTTELPKKATVNFSVYPNPSSNKITIQVGQDSVESIQIVDMFGKTVFTNNISFTGTKVFNLSLAKGIYIVKLTGSKPFSSQKIIID